MAESQDRSGFSMKKSQKSLQKEESKQRILNVGARLFRKQGYKPTGIDQLMREAGLTAGAFYAHFKSKEDLFEQCLEHALKESRRLLIKDTEGLSGEEKTKVVLKRYCSVGHRDFPEKGCVLPALAAEIHRGSVKSSALIATYIDKWAFMIADHLGENLSAEEKRKMALQLVSRSVGALLLSRMVKETPLSEKLLLAAQEI
jgi:TetR/AcrR family transcriptional repressor of nem operon